MWGSPGQSDTQKGLHVSFPGPDGHRTADSCGRQAAAPGTQMLRLLPFPSSSSWAETLPGNQGRGRRAQEKQASAHHSRLLSCRPLGLPCFWPESPGTRNPLNALRNRDNIKYLCGISSQIGYWKPWHRSGELARMENEEVHFS